MSCFIHRHPRVSCSPPQIETTGTETGVSFLLSSQLFNIYLSVIFIYSIYFLFVPVCSYCFLNYSNLFPLYFLLISYWFCIYFYRDNNESEFGLAFRFVVI